MTNYFPTYRRLGGQLDQGAFTSLLGETMLSTLYDAYQEWDKRLGTDEADLIFEAVDFLMPDHDPV